MFLIDTNVISEARKGRRADPGVCAFWADVIRNDSPLFLSAITIGELRRGVDLIHHRGDHEQAAVLEAWLAQVLQHYGDRVLALDGDAAQVWGRLRVPHPQNAKPQSARPSGRRQPPSRRQRRPPDRRPRQQYRAAEVRHSHTIRLVTP